MAITVFKDTTYTLSNLLEGIDRGEIALPDIQRPFVWKSTKVRELFDSMYQGFPIGHLLFWETGAEAGARRIGSVKAQAVPRLMIVDGQQRLTSLYAVLLGRPVVREDYSQVRIRIAFNPQEGSFAVTDAAIEKNSGFIPDISILWDGGRAKKVRHFIQRLEKSRGQLSEEEREHIEESIDHLYDLRNYPFQAMVLGPDVDEEKVADIFVRINSEGVRLGQADFILTLMSVWWEEGRRQLEQFARAARVPSEEHQHSPTNPFIEPSADQLLRVVAGLAFRRGRLRYVYQVLRGKDLETGQVSSEGRNQQFVALQQAQSAALDLTNWHEFLKAVRLAGYRSNSMISSENNLMFSYLMYLIGFTDHSVSRRDLRKLIAQWFFMTSLTGRYTGTFESRIEQDLRRVAQAKNSDDFQELLKGMIATALPGDFWEIQLPSSLETSSAYGPTVFAYQASLVILNARPLFSSLLLSDVLDPSIHAPRASVERHHLFPKAYLETLGIDSRVEKNQIANYAFLEWPDNADIGDSPPHEYFPSLFAELSEQEQESTRFLHALPKDWVHMDYRDFLQERRGMIAQVIRAAFQKLSG